MGDTLIKALAFDDQIRVMALDCTDLVQEAHERHDTWSAATAALGRTLAGTLLLAADIGPEDTLSVTINGNGPAGTIATTANGKGQIKGYINQPHVSLDLNEKGKLDVRGAVGTSGVFSVMKDLGMGEPFTGQVPIVSGEIAEDFTYYLAASEQIPSAVGLGVLVGTDESVLHAGGWMIQVLPGCDDSLIDKIEAAVKNTPQVTDLLQEGLSPEEMAYRLLGRENVRVLAERPVEFYCGCSKDRFAGGMAALTADDIQDMIEVDGGAEAICHFCNEKYQYSVADLEEILAHSQS